MLRGFKSIFVFLKPFFYNFMSHNKLKNKQKNVSIGGQAVIEGVMMRGSSSMATAVRDADGVIRLETKRLTPQKERNRFLRLPLIRGVVSFFSSLVGGSKTLMSCYG